MQISILISSLLIILGIGCAILAIKLRKRSLHLFFAAFFLQTGLFLLLNALDLIHMGFPQAWPLLPIFTGTALLPAGWHRYGVFKANYIVLSVAFVILGVIMLIFALDMVTFSLAQFVRDWWVLLLSLTGLILALIVLSTKSSKKNRGDKASGK